MKSFGISGIVFSLCSVTLPLVSCTFVFLTLPDFPTKLLLHRWIVSSVIMFFPLIKRAKSVESREDEQTVEHVGSVCVFVIAS